MGWESPQRRRKAEEEGAEKAPLSCLFRVSKSLPLWQPRSSVRSALLSSNQFRMHTFSAHTGSAGMPRSPPTEHSLHARHCVQCFTCAIPFCPQDAIRDEGPRLQDFISQERKPGLHGRKWQGGLCDPVASPRRDQLSEGRDQSQVPLCRTNTLLISHFLPKRM